LDNESTGTHEIKENIWAYRTEQHNDMNKCKFKQHIISNNEGIC